MGPHSATNPRSQLRRRGGSTADLPQKVCRRAVSARGMRRRFFAPAVAICVTSPCGFGRRILRGRHVKDGRVERISLRTVLSSGPCVRRHSDAGSDGDLLSPICKSAVAWAPESRKPRDEREVKERENSPSTGCPWRKSMPVPTLCPCLKRDGSATKRLRSTQREACRRARVASSNVLASRGRNQVVARSFESARANQWLALGLERGVHATADFAHVTAGARDRLARHVDAKTARVRRLSKRLLT